MAGVPIELDLPLTEPEDGQLEPRRLHHLEALPGVDGLAAARLSHCFPTLAALYGAPEEKLASVVGPVAAARIRWFLDGPLRPATTIKASQRWSRAA